MNPQKISVDSDGKITAYTNRGTLFPDGEKDTFISGDFIIDSNDLLKLMVINNEQTYKIISDEYVRYGVVNYKWSGYLTKSSDVIEKLSNKLKSREREIDNLNDKLKELQKTFSSVREEIRCYKNLNIFNSLSFSFRKIYSLLNI